MINRPIQLFSLLLIFLLSSCSDIKKVEVTSGDGSVTETYHVNKSTNKKEGAYIRTNSAGTVLEESNYIDDKLDGPRKLFTEKGTLEIEEFYQLGNFEGDYKAYYENGQIELLGNYKNGAMSGVWKKYYESGSIMEEVVFINNQENGPFKEYYENGNKKAEGNYKGGDKEDGLLKLYAEDGQLTKKMKCTKGICQTIWTPEEGDIVPEELNIPNI